MLLSSVVLIHQHIYHWFYCCHYSLRRSLFQKYHKTVKELKRQDTNARKTIFAKSITKDNSRKFWTEIKKIDRGNSYIAASIDGKTQPGEICDIFREKYETLYSSSQTLN